VAYTNSPENQTYRTLDIDFTAAPNNRLGSIGLNRDVQIFNMYWDRVSNENQERWYALKKRPGIEALSYNLQKVTSTDYVNGFFYDRDSNYIYWAIKGKVYNMNLGTGTITLIGTMTNTTSLYVGFCSFLKASTGVRYVIYTDGLECWYTVAGSGTSTEITDAQLPVPHQPFPVFLDNYLFLAKSSTGEIWNSDFDAFDAWTAGNYVTTEINPDYVARIEKVKNYLVAFGTEGIEFFYDAANEAGSPLLRNESYSKRIGYVGGMATSGDKLFFIGKAEGERFRVYVLDGDKCSPVSNSIVERNLNIQDAPATEFNQQYNVGICFSIDGHNFYKLGTVDTVFILDIDNGFWYNWVGPSNDYANVSFQAVWNTTNNGTYIVGYGDEVIGKLNQQVYQDRGVNFTCRYRTEDFNGGTMNWKSCARMILKCDMPTTDATNVSVSWSDDDWNTTATTARNVNVGSSNPYLVQCGRFRTRSWLLEYTDNYPIRFRGLSMDLNVGSV
jgi:hypothetical protein